MDFFQAVIYGIVEGFTEFLPISSTGHLILASKLFGHEGEFQKTFEIAIQLGAILAVVALYWRSLLVDRAVMLRVLLAFVPTALIGLLLYKRIKELLDDPVVVLAALGLGGVALILFEWLHGEKSQGPDHLHGISYAQAVTIGFCQSLAVVVPGMSRAAATVVGGLLLGIPRRTIVEFSFLLAVPTMAAATTFDMMKTSASFTANQWQALAIGFVTSFLVALAAIQLLLRFLKTHTFVPFGVYRLVLACVFWWLLFGSTSAR
jgi:undecaprenyl-diphosphatase